MTPFKALYGRDPPTLLRWDVSSIKNDAVGEHLKERNQILDVLKANLDSAQNRMKKQADTKRREVEFAVGDKVFLKLQPYKFKNLAKRPNEKLSPRFYGPYLIIEKIGKVAYRLDLPGNTRIHDVFHVSQLKPFVGTSVQHQPLPKCLQEDLELQLQPEELLGTRYSEHGTLEVLIKWLHLPPFENSWENFEEINSLFTEFHLEDKVRAKGGGNDRPLVKQVYTRKGNQGKKLMASQGNTRVSTRNEGQCGQP